MQQVAFECQKLIWAGLHQPAPWSQWPLRVLIQDKGGAPWLCQKQHRADQLQTWRDVVRQGLDRNAGGNTKLLEAYVISIAHMSLQTGRNAGKNCPLWVAEISWDSTLYNQGTLPCTFRTQTHNLILCEAGVLQWLKTSWNFPDHMLFTCCEASGPHVYPEERLILY